MSRWGIVWFSVLCSVSFYTFEYHFVPFGGNVFHRGFTQLLAFIFLFPGGLWFLSIYETPRRPLFSLKRGIQIGPVLLAEAPVRVSFSHCPSSWGALSTERVISAACQHRHFLHVFSPLGDAPIFGSWDYVGFFSICRHSPSWTNSFWKLSFFLLKKETHVCIFGCFVVNLAWILLSCSSGREN